MGVTVSMRLRLRSRSLAAAARSITSTHWSAMTGHCPTQPSRSSATASRIEGVSIHDSIITVAMLDRAPHLSFSQPATIAVIRRFRLENETLVEQDVGGDGEFICDDTLPDVVLVIVLSPSAGEEVKSGFIASGCSRTFESNVQWRLLGRSGEVLSSGHTSGGGVDGPGVFQFSVEFAVAQRQVALLEVFEDDVSEGEGYPPPPRVVVPVIIDTAD